MPGKPKTLKVNLELKVKTNAQPGAEEKALNNKGTWNTNIVSAKLLKGVTVDSVEVTRVLYVGE